MKRKTLSILFTFFVFAVMVSITGFGVYASLVSKLTISGTINFEALNKEVYVNQVEIKNYVDENYAVQSTVLSDMKDKYIQDDSSVSIGSNVKALSGETVEIAITMTNLTAEYVKVNVSHGTLATSVSLSTTGLFMPRNTGESLQTGQPKTLKIFIKNTNSGVVSLSSLNINISFTSLGTSLLQDSGSYYYVEMGTEGTTYLKWKLVSQDLTTKLSYPSKPTKGVGYFILESKITQSGAQEDLHNLAYTNDYVSGNPTYHAINGWSSIVAADYATSTIRQYINGTKVYKQYTFTYPTCLPDTSLEYSDFFTDFNIDPENDLVYNQMFGRTLLEMYQDCAYDGSAVEYPSILEDGTAGVVQISSSEVDKLWIPSYTEILNLLCGGTWDNSLSVYSDYYHLRSHISSTAGRPDVVDSTGRRGNSAPNDSFHAARPMFRIYL